MLGSCSKDDTEVAPIEVKGKAAFSASMIIGDGVSSRTHVGDLVNGVYPYYWDKGDAIGASALGTSAVVPFIVDASKFENANDNVASVDFYPQGEDLAYFGEESIYLAYPYDKAVKVSGSQGSEVMNMTIPASQRYRANSFATMTAPAVGIINPEDIVDDQVPDVEMKPVASYVRFGVVGCGKLTSISLTVKNSDGKYFVLNGSADVPLTDGSDYALKLNTSDPTETTAAAAHTNTIDFGKGGIDLAVNDPAYLWFVVPADVKYSNATLTFTATVDNAESVVEKTYKGDYDAVRNGVLDIPVNIELGMEDKVLIENNADLLEYLYAVSKGTSDPAATDYVKAGAFKTAILTGNLNFNRYDARNDINGADDVLQAALTEYMANGNAIAPIAEGAKIDGGNYTVSYLAVKGDAIRGNGIFGAKAASLKNITFSNTTVTPDADEENPVFFGALPTESEGVKVSGGTLVTTAENAAVLGEIVLDDLNKVAVKSYPKNSDGASVYYAAKITLNSDVVASNADVRAYFNSSARRFGAIKATSDVKISGVSTTYVPFLLEAISYEGGDKAISVLDKTTSYWTGGVASAAPANGTVETAEQLAYVVKKGGSRLTLANNIDLQGEEGKVWTVAGNKRVAIDGAAGKTKPIIKNAKIGFVDAGSPVMTGYYSLLGSNVTVSNLTVSNVKIDVDNVTSRAYVGGLGVTGSANGVTVSDLSIKIGSNVKAINGNVIGGLVSTLSAASAGNVVTALTIDLGGKEGVTVGGLFGSLNVKAMPSFDSNKVSYDAEATAKYPLLGAWTVYGSIDVAACRVCVEDPTNPTNPIVSTEENPIAPVVGVITFNPANVTPGTQILLNLDDCSTPYYSEIKNAVDYAYNVKINGTDVPVYKPE